MICKISSHTEWYTNPVEQIYKLRIFSGQDGAVPFFRLVSFATEAPNITQESSERHERQRKGTNSLRP